MPTEDNPLPARARSAKTIATTIVLATMLFGQSTTQATAAHANGTLTTAYVSDGLCLTGPHKNSSTAALSATFSAVTSGHGEFVY